MLNFVITYLFVFLCSFFLNLENHPFGVWVNNGIRGPLRGVPHNPFPQKRKHSSLEKPKFKQFTKEQKLNYRRNIRMQWFKNSTVTNRYGISSLAFWTNNFIRSNIAKLENNSIYCLCYHF